MHVVFLLKAKLVFVQVSFNGYDLVVLIIERNSCIGRIAYRILDTFLIFHNNKLMFLLCSLMYIIDVYVFIVYNSSLLYIVTLLNNVIYLSNIISISFYIFTKSFSELSFRFYHVPYYYQINNNPF